MLSAVEAAKKQQVSLEEAWSECERELQVRFRIFDTWVEAGKLSWADARDRYARMQKAAALLKRLVNDQQPQTDSESAPVTA
jgi:hypothetical protein